MRLISIVFTTLVGSTIGALAAPPPVPLNCDIQLFRHIETDKVRQENYSFLLDLVTEDNYSDMQRSADTSWDGPYGFFKGDFKAFDVKRRNYRSEHQLTTDVKYSRDYALSTVGSDGLEAYKACLNALQPTQSLIIYRDNDASVDKLITFVVKLSAAPLTIGPRLSKMQKWVPVTLAEQGTFFYQSRVPENDWQYQIDDAPVQFINETFKGNACLCANKKRSPATLPFAKAGLCTDAADNVKIDTATVNLNRELLQPFDCAGQMQSKPVLVRSDEDGVCYAVIMSLNADRRPSKSCTIAWVLRGTAKKLQTVFVSQ